MRPSLRNFSITVVIFLWASLLFAQWGPDVRLTYDPAESSTHSINSGNNTYQVSASGDTVHVVWYDYRSGSTPLIYYKRSLDGGSTWESDVLLGSGASEINPCVDVSGQNVHIVWDDYLSGSGWRVYYKRSTDGGTTWSSGTVLSGGLYPSVTVSGSNVHVVWTNLNDVYYRRSTDNGITWRSSVIIGPGTNWSNWSPAIAVSGLNVYVVWYNEQNSGDIFYMRSTDNGTTWEPQSYLVDQSYGSYKPCISASGSNVHVVWRDDRDGNREIYYKRSADGGATWEPDVRLTNTPVTSDNPSIASSGSNIHIVWDEGPIYYIRSTDNGTTWGSPVQLSTGSGASDHPSVAVSDTSVHVVWQDNRDGNWEIYYKGNPTGNIGVHEIEYGGIGAWVQKNRPTPNPFVNYTAIPGHEQKNFTLYDISGRIIGTYKGNRIGQGLPAGVYFLTTESKNAKPVRVVKIR